MPTPLLCETVTGRTMAELIVARDAVRHADMVEVRLDGVADADPVGAVAGRRLPVVVTCRPVWEGGCFDGSEEERLRLLTGALGTGAEFVDVEWKAAHANLLGLTGGRRVILSSHDFSGVPSDLCDRVAAMRATGAEVVKVAVMTRRLSDTLPLLDLPRGGNLVSIGMGAAGIATRVLAAQFGSCWTYAGPAVAPGQISSEEMVSTYRFHTLGEGTKVYGVAGKPVMHSLSPVMHNAAFAAREIDAVYLPLEAADFDDFERFAARLDLRGASVTIPYKLDAIRQAHLVDADARAFGAANTLRRGTIGWEATNTDAAGFLAPLDVAAGQRGWATIDGARAAILGAGGAARAVAHGLTARGARVTVHARNPRQARAVAESVGGAVGTWPVARGTWDLLVNCTPLGSVAQPNESPLPGGPFTGHLVYDLVYAPTTTRLLREAGAAGCATIGGLAMLVAQAERQFEWWAGVAPPAGLMARVAGTAMHLREGSGAEA
jgi:3-dehydroquinate dehydratase/shikimate dehydrogenase